MSQLDDILMVITAVSALSTVVAWPVFCFLSMRRIEARVREEGRDRTGWDGVGGRVPLYAFVICLPFPGNRMKDYRLIDVEAVRHHATSRDKVLAIWLTFSLLLMTVSVLLGSILF
jgi:hypothetical protein